MTLRTNGNALESTLLYCYKQSESKPMIWPLQLVILKPRSQGDNRKTFPLCAALQVPQKKTPGVQRIFGGLAQIYTYR
jgi:hypothetical protein